ncbi:MAG: hypothetical protein AB1656_18755 [Candidatus Omnitrophota bacterium]
MQEHQWISRYWQEPLLAVLLVLFYGAYLAPRCWRYVYLTWDSLRDLIAAQHILAGGGWFSDPMLLGHSCWYPPLHALFCAAAVSIFPIDIFRFYALAPVLLNWIFPAAFYHLARRLLSGNRTAAFWATLALAAMPWAVTYVLASPTVMAHAAGFAILLFIFHLHLLEKYSQKKNLIFSLCTGLMGLYHPPTFLILTAVISIHWLIQAAQSKRKPFLRRWLFFLTLSLTVCSPYWLPNLAQPLRNPAPLAYISPGLTRHELFLPGASWLLSLPLLFLAVLGVVSLLRRWKESPVQFILALLAVSLIGQAPGYLKILLEKRFTALDASIGDKIPILVPHEFQFYFQIALCLCLGIGLAQLQASQGARKLIYWAAAIGFAASLTINLIHLPQRCQVFLWPYRLSGEWNDPVKAILAHTAVNDAIAAPNDETSFFIIGVRTGRKCLLSYPTHTNTRADLPSRRQAREILFHSYSTAEVLQTAERWRVQFILCKIKLVSSDRIAFFREIFPSVYDDGVVSIFRVEKKGKSLDS